MIAAVRRLSHRLSSRLRAAESGVTVLAYHLVGGGTGSPVDVPLDAFRRQMTELADNLPVLGLDRVVTALAAGRPVAGPAVVLTFDDAYRNFRTAAWPVLRQLGLPATLFVPVGFVAGTAPPPLHGADLPALSWRELRELVGEGLEVGSHSLTHPDLRSLAPPRLEEELRASRDRLSAELERPVDLLAYPRALWNRRVVRAAEPLYRAAVAAGGRRLPADRSRLHRLPRVPVRRDLSVPFPHLVRSPLWLEEWGADLYRRHRLRWGC